MVLKAENNATQLNLVATDLGRSKITITPMSSSFVTVGRTGRIQPTFSVDDAVVAIDCQYFQCGQVRSSSKPLFLVTHLTCYTLHIVT